MAAVNHVVLLSEQLIDSDTTTTSFVKALPNHAVEFIIESSVTERVDGTFTTTVQHSPDGNTWFTVGSTAAQSANGLIIANVTGNQIFGYIRASVLSASTTDGAKLTVKLWYRNER